MRLILDLAALPVIDLIFVTRIEVTFLLVFVNACELTEPVLVILALPDV